MVDVVAILGGAAALYTILKPRPASPEDVKKIVKEIVQKVPPEERAALAEDPEAVKELVSGRVPPETAPPKEAAEIAQEIVQEVPSEQRTVIAQDPKAVKDLVSDHLTKAGILPEHTPNEILVQFEDDVDVDHGLKELQAKYPKLDLSLKRILWGNLAVLKTSDVERSINLSVHPLVRYAEPSYTMRAL